MAAETQSRPTPSCTDTDYTNCLITPMGRNGDTSFNAEHLVDAVLVGILAFSSVILVDVVPALLSAHPTFLTPSEILARIPTALVAFLLAFAFQWLRARGLDVVEAYRKFKESLP